MNFIIEKKKLNDVMNRVSRLFAVTVILPIYRGIKLCITEEGLTIIVSDGTVSLVEFVNTDIEIYEYGECVVDGRVFSEIVKKANDEKIWIRKEGKQLKFKSGKAEMKLVIFQEQYPNINFDYPNTKFQINSEILKDAVEKTIFSANDQQTRPVLGGLNFKVNQGECTITGTDSYRLSQLKVPVTCNHDINITIPKKMLMLLPMIFPGDDELFVHFSKQKALMSSDNIIIQSVLLDGVFPDVEQLIPLSFNTEVKFSTKPILDALDRTSFCRDDGITIVSFDLLSDEIVLTSASQEIGSSIETIPFISVTGSKDVRFSCNQKYMLEALRAFSSSECTLKFNSNMKPFILQCEKDEGHIQLLLPVHHH